MRTSLKKRVAVFALACSCNSGFVLAETPVLDNAPLHAVENRTQMRDFEAFADIPSNPQDPEQLAIQGRFIAPVVVLVLDAAALCIRNPNPCIGAGVALTGAVVTVIKKVKAICAKPSVSVC